MFIYKTRKLGRKHSIKVLWQWPQAGAEGREDGGHRKNVWNITKEQLNYYTTQFFSMQENPGGVIPGNQVTIFEKGVLIQGLVSLNLLRS